MCLLPCFALRPPTDAIFGLPHSSSLRRSSQRAFGLLSSPLLPPREISSYFSPLPCSCLVSGVPRSSPGWGCEVQRPCSGPVCLSGGSKILQLFGQDIWQALARPWGVFALPCGQCEFEPRLMRFGFATCSLTILGFCLLLWNCCCCRKILVARPSAAVRPLIVFPVASLDLCKFPPSRRSEPFERPAAAPRQGRGLLLQQQVRRTRASAVRVQIQQLFCLTACCCYYTPSSLPGEWTVR